ncbi:MAG: hypothetical protein RIG62_01915 [Cyclobacteriaceae bacterium]
MLATDKLNSLVLSCLFLIHERELQQQQEVTVVAAKVTRSKFLKKRYFASVQDWLPEAKYLSYAELNTDASCDN